MSDVVKLYKNKEWLDEQINVLGKTQAQVAKECGVGHTTISYWINNNYREYVKDYQKEYNRKNKEVISKTRSIYYENNRVTILEKCHMYYEENKENVKINTREYAEKNKDAIRIKSKLYRNKHAKDIKQNKISYYNKNRNEINKKCREYNLKIKIGAFNVLGGCECEICGDKNIKHLTIDHINENGNLERKKGLSGSKLNNAIIKGELSEEQLSNLRVLCFNHNCSRSRGYLDPSMENLINKRKRYSKKLWAEAFNFFGPCPCGVSELKFLTISHVHNDGAERRKNGEKDSSNLLAEFRKLGWPESLKEDYCLECFNCNCSRGNRE